MRLPGIPNKILQRWSPWKSLCISSTIWKKKPWNGVFIPSPGTGKGRGPQHPEEKPMKQLWETACLLTYARWTDGVRSKIRIRANRLHPYLRLGRHVSPAKLAPPLPTNQCVTHSPPPHQPCKELALLSLSPHGGGESPAIPFWLPSLYPPLLFSPLLLLCLFCLSH